MRHADGVGDLDFAFFSQPGSYDILGDVPAHVGGAAVNLGGILAGKRAAAMTTWIAVTRAPRPMITWLAILTMTVANLVALAQTNLKRLLAYSSIAQIGYILLGASFVTLAGLTASTVHLFNHALAKGALFLAVGCLATQSTGLRLSDLGGIAKRMPWTSAAFIVAGFSLVGVPGTAGFISKWYLITAALEHGSLGIALVAVLVISSLMAVVYIWRIVEAIYFSEPVADQSAVREAPRMMLLITWVAALANLYFGLVPEVPVTLASSAAETLLEHLP